MRRLWAAATMGLACGGMCALLTAQSPAAEWVTSQGNAQRTGWQKQAGGINPGSVRHFQKLWSFKTNNLNYQLAGMVEPLIAADVATSYGAKTLIIAAGSASNVYALDASNGNLVWQAHLTWVSSTPETPRSSAPGGFICQNALTDTPAITPEGGSGPRYVYVIGQDGYLHTLGLADGIEHGTPIQVTPHPYPKVNGLTLLNGSVYTIQGQGCNGNPNTVYATDLAAGKTTELMPRQAGMWGEWGVAVGTDGDLFASTGDGAYNAAQGQFSTSVLKISPKTMTVVNYFTPARHQWLTMRDLDMNFSVPVFIFQEQQYLVASGKEGRFYLINTTSMGGPTHMQPASETPLISNVNANFQTQGSWGGGSSWTDTQGTVWVLAPVGGPTNPAVKFPVVNGPAPDGSVAAFKVEERNGRAVLEPAWRSTNMVTAQTPVITGGVVFELGGGEFTGQADDNGNGLFSAKDRVERSSPAVLYALDAQTGRELWNSGHDVTSFVHQGGMAVAGGRVVFGTDDGTVYCYGLQ